MLISEYQSLESLGQGDEGPAPPSKQPPMEDGKPKGPESVPHPPQEGDDVYDDVYIEHYETESPSGRMVTITEDEEAEAIREAITQSLVAKLTRWDKVEEAIIGAVGNAVGFAIGGFLIGLFLKESGRK